MMGGGGSSLPAVGAVQVDGQLQAKLNKLESDFESKEQQMETRMDSLEKENKELKDEVGEQAKELKDLESHKVLVVQKPSPGAFVEGGKYSTEPWNATFS